MSLAWRRGRSTSALGAGAWANRRRRVVGAIQIVDLSGRVGGNGRRSRRVTSGPGEGDRPAGVRGKARDAPVRWIHHAVVEQDRERPDCVGAGIADYGAVEVLAPVRG